jgi:hypothetical protein
MASIVRLAWAASDRSCKLVRTGGQGGSLFAAPITEGGHAEVDGAWLLRDSDRSR